jgi:outer membrane protein assembly factor BamB
MAIDKSLKKVIWSVKIKRDSSAIPVPDSFILLNNLIYLNGKYCIDAISGKMIWINKNIGSGVEVLDRHLFTLSKDGELFKLDLTNGSIIWKETIEPSVAPIYAKDNTLMIGTERGNIYLIDERYGEIITSFKTNSILTIPIVSDEKNIYAISEDGYLYCFKRK